ncbi:ribokinase [Alloscardovia theropitheci]|uniref:Ribokinase n=1 Tax=Alloscardovia theropitheci TaxID=2496842 RepID=A0A4R0QRC4_9BIFI|nr:ribokinase [Alloscardovia theropitheci]TCD54912.1 ribokinase [Alloscardovia theropitheci]
MEKNTVLDMLAQLNGAVAVVGSMNADYTVRVPRFLLPGETLEGGALEILPGGKSSNQAATAAKLGAKVTMFGALGTDSNADFLAGKLEEAGVDTNRIARLDGPSGTTVITVSEADGENTIVYSAGSNRKVTPEYIRENAQALTDAKVLGLCLESPMETVIEAARIAHEADMPVLLNNSPFMANLPQELIDNTDILLANEHETAQIIGMDDDGIDWSTFDWESMRVRLAEMGFHKVIITLGALGSCVIDGETITRVDGVRINPVDTTGCGDSYMGTVLAGLASGFDLTDSARMAAYVAAYAACGYGAQASYGTVAQIREAFSL